PAPGRRDRSPGGPRITAERAERHARDRLEFERLFGSLCSSVPGHRARLSTSPPHCPVIHRGCGAAANVGVGAYCGRKVTTSAHPALRKEHPMAASKSAPKSTAKDRGSSLDNALAQIDRQFGKGSIMRLGDDTRPPVEVIPTGSVALDAALGVGGLPRGRIVEIYGPESSGKTTVALHAVANAQRNGGIAAFIDAEHALDPEYAKKL